MTKSKLALVPSDERKPRCLERRDKRGRRIGRNWWREMNCEMLQHSEDAWQSMRFSGLPAYGVAGAAHSGAAMYQLSEAEFRELHPRPTLKAFLIGNKGMADSESEGAA